MTELQKLIKQYETSRKKCIPLIASENHISKHVLNCLSTDLEARYYIHNNDSSWSYPNQEILHKLQCYCKSLAMEIFHGSSVILSALSGNQCVAGIIFGTIKKGDSVLGVSPDNGGHWALKEITNIHDVKLHHVPFNEEQNIDIEKLCALCDHVTPRLIMIDCSHVLFPPSIKPVRKALGNNIPIYYDISQTFGLVGGGVLTNPLSEGATCIHGSTHKSLFGPQKGLLVFGSNFNEKVSQIEKALHPAMASNIHMHHVAALTAALEEMKSFGTAYAKEVVKNARFLSKLFYESGLSIPYHERNFTDTHQVWIRMPNLEKARSGFETLQKCGIFVNLVNLPFSLGHGLRLGTSEITRLGYSKKDIEKVAQLIIEVIQSGKKHSLISKEVKLIANRNNRTMFTF